MGKETSISWTRHTFNPWWGCEKVSPGCAHCYAETFSKRTGHTVWGANAPRRFFGDKHWGEPLRWDIDAAKLGERHRVFCASMADWLEDRDDLVAPLAQLLELIRVTPNLDWLLLTKRPENWLKRITDAIMWNWCEDDQAAALHAWGRNWINGQPPANVWIGTTVEDQQRADKRIPELLKIPAKVRFLSCEPLLGPVDLRGPGLYAGDSIAPAAIIDYEPRIHWAIAGGESGPGFRPFNPDWARSLRDQCKAAHVAFHMKQMGGLKPSMMPSTPNDLMIREYPQP